MAMANARMVEHHGIMIMINQNIFPTDWKLAHVIPLFKAGNKSFPSNYRPVSLLSCVSKLLEKIVKISCSLTIICERTFLHLTSKGGRSLFLSFRSETEQKCLFNIPAFFETIVR
jgi:hypothetical protein